MPDKAVGAALVVGGGIAGMQASLDLAESGIKVYLVDKSPAIGGVMAQLDKTFPTNDCAMCTLAPRMVDTGRHTNIEKLTYSEVVGVEGQAGHFRARVRKKARSVDTSKCTGCEECTRNCLVTYRAYPQQPVMLPKLSGEDRGRLDEIFEHHKDKTAPLIGVLQEINAEFNYLPPDILRHVSNDLDIPLAHIVKVATFYSLFSLKPRGKHLITVCQGTTCFVRGSERLMEEVQNTIGIKPGEVSKDGKFSLEIVRCIGCCALAPTMRIDQKVHAKVHPNCVSDILRRC